MNWPIPPFADHQYSIGTPYADADNCTEQALCHAIWMMTGFRASPRALAWMVDVTPAGSEVSKAVDVANKRGLIPYDLWPTPDNFTWDSYYEDIPQSVLDQAVPVKIELIPTDVTQSPLLVELEFNPNASFPGPYHLVAQFSPTQYFDSERWNNDTSTVRDLNFLGTKVIWSSSIKLTLKNMSNTKFIHKKGSQEYAFIVPAMSEESMKDKALNYGREDIIKPDGTINFTLAEEVEY